MKRDIKVKGMRRKEIDADKLAFALLLLAKQLHKSGSDASDAQETRAGETPDAGAAR